MLGHVEMKDPSPIEAEDKEHVENAERRRGHDSEIYREGLVQMIAKERCPSLPGARWRRDLGHVARNGDFRYFDAELEQLTVNSGGGSEASESTDVHRCHLDDQSTNFEGNSRSAETALSTLPPPEEFEALAMPGQDRGRLHHGQTFPPAIPETR